MKFFKKIRLPKKRLLSDELESILKVIGDTKEVSRIFLKKGRSQLEIAMSTKPPVEKKKASVYDTPSDVNDADKYHDPSKDNWNTGEL